MAVHAEQREFEGERERAHGAQRRRRALGWGAALALGGLSAVAALPSVDAPHPNAALAYGDAIARSARALRAGVAALEDERLEEADRHFARVRALGEVADYADLLWARGLQDRDDSPRAAAVALRALRDHRDSPLRGDFHRLLGDVRLSFGDGVAARAAWRSALAEADGGSEASELRLSIAKSYEDDGQKAKAIEAYRELWTREPASVEAEEAERRLRALGEAPDADGSPASAWRRRGDRLFRARRNERALAAYEKALALGLKKSEKRRAQKKRAQTLFRLRRYPEAVNAFAALPQTDDTPIWHARSLARANRVMESIEHFEAIAATQRNAIGLRATYLAATLLDGRNYEERARRHFERVAGSGHELATASLWRLAWADYRAGRYEKALPRLDRLASREKGIDALRPRYWRARSKEQLGDPAAAGEFLEINLEYPFTYYGVRAHQRIGNADIDERAVKPVPKGRDVLADQQLARPRILVAAGLPEEARQELGRLRRKAKGLRDRLEVAQLYADAGDPNGAQRVVLLPYLDRLARGPAEGHEALWWHAWPLAFRPEVDRATGVPKSVSRDLVYAIMREESGYRPKVLSVSGARGLMQIMIPTGRKLASDVGLGAFAPDDLFDADTNVFLGTHYLYQLSQLFPTRPSAAIASYNAGPGAVSGWLRRDPSVPDDEWVEAIPYDQTQHYVKRVMRSQHVYRVLY